MEMEGPAGSGASELAWLDEALALASADFGADALGEDSLVALAEAEAAPPPPPAAPAAPPAQRKRSAELDVGALEASALGGDAAGVCGGAGVKAVRGGARSTPQYREKKANREKARRNNLNERCNELAELLNIGGAPADGEDKPSIDKVTLVGHACRAIESLRDENATLRRDNDRMQKELTQRGLGAPAVAPVVAPEASSVSMTGVLPAAPAAVPAAQAPMQAPVRTATPTPVLGHNLNSLGSGSTVVGMPVQVPLTVPLLTQLKMANPHVGSVSLEQLLQLQVASASLATDANEDAVLRPPVA